MTLSELRMTFSVDLDNRKTNALTSWIVLVSLPPEWIMEEKDTMYAFLRFV